MISKTVMFIHISKFSCRNHNQQIDTIISKVLIIWYKIFIYVLKAYFVFFYINNRKLTIYHYITDKDVRVNTENVLLSMNIPQIPITK